MRLHIDNIGGLANADIVIDGISIIAGENNVGKSTIGKSFYAFLKDMNSWQETYERKCRNNVAHFINKKSTKLEDLSMELSGAIRRRTSKAQALVNNFVQKEDFIVAIEDYQVAEDETEKRNAVIKLRRFLHIYCEQYLELYLKKDTDWYVIENEEKITEWIDDIISDLERVELDELVMQRNVINQSFQTIFQNQYRKINSYRSQISFIDDNHRKVYMMWHDGSEKLSAPLRINQQIFFIESPKIYDYLSNVRYGHVQKEYLRYLMMPNVFRQKDSFMIKSDTSEELSDIAEDNEDINKILDDLTGIMNGRAEFFQKVGLEFKDKKIKEPIHAVNVSTGLKSVALLEYALRIGAIRKGDILILDEPEINLHPAWQKEYARTLVELQKLFDLRIIVTTHSPYFVRAIECFSDLNDMMDSLNVYKITKAEGNNVVENLSYSEYGLTSLYEDLSAPLDDLEELLAEKYDMD